MKQNVYCVIFVIRRSAAGDELLLARRAPNRYMEGTWQPIAGKVKDGEAAWQAALRELQEETGLRPTEFYRITTLGHFYHPLDDSLNVAPMFCAIVDPSSSVVLNDEHTHHEWVPVASAAERLTWPVDKAAIAEVEKEMLGNGPLKPHLILKLE